MVKTWVASIVPLYDKGCGQSYYEQLPVFRREKADRLRVERARMQSIGAWVLYERMKKEYDVSEEAVYNLSHSGNYVLCSLETDPTGKRIQVGCDIEEEKEEIHLSIAKRFFCPSEYIRILEEKDKKERCRAFYRYWVLKESYLKATREGMALEMNAFEIALDTPPVLIRQPDRYPDRYYYMESAVTEDAAVYRIAVCSTDPVIEAVKQAVL